MEDENETELDLAAIRKLYDTGGWKTLDFRLFVDKEEEKEVVVIGW